MKESLCPTLDRAFAALVTDLDRRGLLDSTLVWVNSEFGRTPRVNSNAGRDHWPWAYSLALAGGGIAGGLCLGATDAIAAYPTRHPHDPVGPGRHRLSPARRPARHDHSRPAPAPVRPHPGPQDRRACSGERRWPGSCFTRARSSDRPRTDRPRRRGPATTVFAAGRPRARCSVRSRDTAARPRGSRAGSRDRGSSAHRRRRRRPDRRHRRRARDRHPSPVGVRPAGHRAASSSCCAASGKRSRLAGDGRPAGALFLVRRGPRTRARPRNRRAEPGPERKITWRVRARPVDPAADEPVGQPP